MRTLSAADCINPALERARAILLPFNWRLWIKLGFVTLLAEAGSQISFPPLGGGHSSGAASQSLAATAISPLTAVIFFIVGLIFFAVFLVLFYLGSRMQMVFMEIAATRQTLVAPLWQRHGPHTWRWVGIKLLVIFAFLLGAGILFAAPAIYLFRNLPLGHALTPTPASLGSIVLLFLCIAVFVVILIALLSLLRDLVLPFIVFQDATFGDALNNAIAILRREPGNVFLYLALKIGLVLVAGLAVDVALFLAVIAGVIPLGAIAAIVWFSLHRAGSFALILAYVALGLLAAIFLAWIFLTMICAFGATQLFLQAFALYFLGGRYPLLGNILEPPIGFSAPPPPHPYTPPPGWLPPTPESAG